MSVFVIAVIYRNLPKLLKYICAQQQHCLTHDYSVCQAFAVCSKILHNVILNKHCCLEKNEIVHMNN